MLFAGTRLKAQSRAKVKKILLQKMLYLALAHYAPFVERLLVSAGIY